MLYIINVLFYQCFILLMFYIINVLVVIMLSIHNAHRSRSFIFYFKFKGWKNQKRGKSISKINRKRNFYSSYQRKMPLFSAIFSEENFTLLLGAGQL